MTQSQGSDDATLAVAAASGDRLAFAAIYDRYSTRLLGFCISMLRSRADAEDCLQDVFVIAATRLRDLREPGLLRSWLFAVARHECLARIERRRREVPVDEIPDQAAVDVDAPSPVLEAELGAQLAALLRDAEAGLSDRDRLLLELADRQQLSGEEFAQAIGVPRSTAYTLLARARATARKSIGALLVARTGRRQCATLDGMLTGWDGQLTTLRRKQIARHIEKCDVCSEQERRVATPAALLGAGPAYALDLVALRTRILSAAVAGAVPAVAWRGGWPPSDPIVTRVPRRRRAGVAGAIAASLLVIAAIGLGVAGARNAVTGAGSSVTSAGSSASSSLAPTSSSPASPSPSRVSPSPAVASTVTVTHVVVVPPPTRPATSSAPKAVTLTVDTPATVLIDRVTHDCTTNACTYTVANGARVEVESNLQYPLASSPTSCAAGTPSFDCVLTMSADDTVSVEIIQ